MADETAFNWTEIHAATEARDLSARTPPPTVGRIVHYQSYGTPGGEYKPSARAAVVTQVSPAQDDLTVGLCILNPTGQFFNPTVPYSEIPKPGCWNWPPRG